MSPAKAQAAQAVVREFHYTVRGWFAEMPLNANLHTALDVLHFALHLTNGQLNKTIDSTRPDRRLDRYRSDVDCGE